VRWASLIFAVVGAASAIAGIGLLLMAAGQPVTPDVRRGWLLKRNLGEVLERPRRVERFIYRHHRLFGGAVVAGALTLLVLIGIDYGRMVATSVWRSAPGAQLALVAVYALVVFALIIGIYIAVRPSALKGFESLANRWIQLFPATRRTSRQIGGALLVAGIVCLMVAVRMSGA